MISEHPDRIMESIIYKAIMIAVIFWFSHALDLLCVFAGEGKADFRLRRLLQSKSTVYDSKSGSPYLTQEWKKSGVINLWHRLQHADTFSKIALL